MVRFKKEDYKRSCKPITGGLLLVNPLASYPEELIYKRLLRRKLSEKNADNVSQIILDDLKMDPITTPEFVRKFHHFNQINWVQAKFDALENSSKESTLKHFKSNNGAHYFKINVDKKFIDANKLREKCQLFVCENFYNIEAKGYTGFIDQIYERDSLLIVKFYYKDNTSKFDTSQKYQVIAVPTSLVFDTRCRVLETMNLFPGRWSECIFPTHRKELSQQLISLSDYECFERVFISSTIFATKREFNEKQKIAIHSIVSGLHEQLPYILFGPPGTGKTVTLVESVRLICENNSNARILICTPSNTAADAFTLRLMATNSFTSGSILRIFSLSKNVFEQNRLLFDENKDVLCIMDAPEGRQFGIPPRKELIEKKRVLICTLNTSTYLISGDLIDCFTHIFIDEAGQADELEALIPIVGLMSYFNKNTRIVLAGDPKQLGSVQTCYPLKSLAKSKSLIERLTECGREYKNFDFDKRITTMLEDNYRSHPVFLTIPSSLYYGGKLKACAPIHTRNTLCDWDGLPNKNNFPLLWHSTATPEQRDLDNKSYQNQLECKIVCDYVQKLIEEAKVKSKDIGIITPYRYQIKLLRNKFAKTHPHMLIDSVERFQGCERRVIIISTVRSTGLGFLDCAKRFNTAITRPKELLIIVGDCNNLAKIHFWKKLINFCKENGALINNNNSIIPSVIQKNALLKNKTNTTNNNILEEKINKRRNKKSFSSKFSGLSLSQFSQSLKKNNDSKKRRERRKRNRKNNKNIILEDKNEQKLENDSTDEEEEESASIESLKNRLEAIDILISNSKKIEKKEENNNIKIINPFSKEKTKEKIFFQISEPIKEELAVEELNKIATTSSNQQEKIKIEKNGNNKSCVNENNKNIKNMPVASNKFLPKLKILEEEMKQLKRGKI